MGREWIFRISVAGWFCLVLACDQAGPAEPDPQDRPTAFAARAANDEDDPVVVGVDPDTASQDTTLDIVVKGDNYDRGSTVRLGLDGEPSPDIETNSTRFVNPKKLIANITISADAALESYDVIVTTSRGRKGIGIELFTVVRKGNPNDPIVTATFTDPADAADGEQRVFSDGRGLYIDAIDEVLTEVHEQLIFRPFYPRKPGKTEQRRWLCLRFTADLEVTGGGVPPELADDLDETGTTCTSLDLRTVWHDNGGGLEAMTAVGETLRAEARMIWTDGENNQFKLEYFCRGDRGGDDGTTDCSNLLDVALERHDGDSRTWSIRSDPAAVAVLSRNYTTGPPNPFEPLAAFHMPFELIVTKDPPA